MPISLIEVQVMGIPSVVMDSVGNRDIVSHRINGYMAKNTEKLIKWTRYLCENKELREKIGKVSRQSALKRFNAERVISELMDGYLNAISKRKEAA